MNLFLASVVTAVVAVITVLSGDTSKDIPPIVLLLIGSNMIQLVLLHKEVRKQTTQIDGKINAVSSAVANIFGKSVALRDGIVNGSSQNKEDFDDAIEALEKAASKHTKAMSAHMRSIANK